MKITNDRYKLMQINFDVNTFTYFKCEYLQLVLFVLKWCQWPLNSKEFTFYTKIYAVIHERFNLGFETSDRFFNECSFLFELIFAF